MGCKFTFYYDELEDGKERFGIPDLNLTIHTKDGDYTRLTKKGYIPKGSIINKGDIIIGKYSLLPKDYDPRNKYQDKSTVYKSDETAIVHKVVRDRNEDGKRFIKIAIRKLRGVVIGDKFCRLPTAEVLTDKGWISFKDIDLNCKVATLKDGKFIKYVKPTKKYVYNHDGDMYHLKNQQLHTTCTLNHKLYVKKRRHTNFELIEARNVLGKRVRFKKDGLKNNSNIETLTFELDDESKIEYNSNWFLQLLGMFISDGYAREPNCISICARKQRKIDLHNVICDKLNLVSKYHNHETQIRDKNIYEILKPLSVGALNKQLPEYVWKFNTNQSRILLNTLITGDGSYNNNGSACYYTSSVKLANDVQRLALHAGWSGCIKKIRDAGYESITKSTGQIIHTNADTLSVRIVKSKNNPQINHGHVHEQNIQIEETIQYKGKVYCIEVPDTHIFYCREDQFSSPMWDGNSSRAGLITSGPR